MMLERNPPVAKQTPGGENDCTNASRFDQGGILRLAASRFVQHGITGRQNRDAARCSMGKRLLHLTQRFALSSAERNAERPTRVAGIGCMVGPFSLIGRQHRHDHISELTREFVFDQRGSHRQRTVVEEPPFAARAASFATSASGKRTV